MKRIYTVLVIYAIIISFIFCSCVAASKEGRNSSMKNPIKFQPLTIEEGEQIYPKSFETEKYDEDYLLLQAAYLAAFNTFLQEKVDIDKYQKELDDSEVEFIYTDKTIYYKIGSFGRKNISLRNTPFIERLSEEQKKVLSDAIGKGTIDVTEAILNMVELTWKELIAVKLEEGVDEPYTIVYDMDAFEHEAMSDALAFEICYETQYDENENIFDEELEKNKYDQILSLKKKMEEEIAEKLDCNVMVFIKNRG